MNGIILSLPVLALMAIINAIVFYFLMKSSKSEDESIRALSKSINRGTRAYQKKQYILELVFTILLALLITWQWSFKNGIAFFVGAFVSLFINLLSINSSLFSGEKAAHALYANNNETNSTAILFKSGMLSASRISSVTLLVLFCAYYLLQKEIIDIYHMISFALGVCFFALLERITAGIMGEVAESEIALINKEQTKKDSKFLQALNYLTNLKYHLNGIGSREADFFDSLIASTTAALVLSIFQQGFGNNWLLLPLFILAAGFISFFIAAYLVKIILRKKWKPDNLALPITAFILLMVISYYLIIELELPFTCFWSILIGVITGFAIMLISKYYTIGKTVKGIAEASKTGAATNIITGLASAMKSTAFPVLLISTAIYLSYRIHGFYGTSLSAVTLSSFLLMASAMNAWGSAGQVSLNMLHTLKSKSKHSMGKDLKASSHIAIAFSKGLSITVAALTGYTLFGAFKNLAMIKLIDITRAEVVIGSFAGAVIPFLVASLAIIAVVNVTQGLENKMKMLKSSDEKNQGEENSFLKNLIKSAHSSSLKQVILPVLLIIGSPICFTPLFGLQQGLAGFLAGVIFTGILLAFFLSYGGITWENTIFYIDKIAPKKEDESLYNAYLVGRLIGNPLQEVAGPSMSIVIKFIPLLSLILISLF
jgi:K(+)-stimulated pyrophosphate-energized sodium pump